MARAQALRQKRTTPSYATLEARIERLEAEIALLAYGDRFRQLAMRVVRLERTGLTES